MEWVSPHLTGRKIYLARIKGTYSQVSEINFLKIMSEVDLDVTNKNLKTQKYF